MGAVASRIEDGAIVARDQERLCVTSLKITTERGRILYTITPNAYPATHYTVRKEQEDEVTEYIQDPETSASAPPSFLLRLSNEEGILFYFTFAIRQTQSTNTSTATDSTRPTSSTISDTIINSLTFISACTSKELDSLVTREFNVNPNIHKHPSVSLVGDYTSGGKPIEHFDWSWKWRPPKQDRDRGGWRNACSFVEYDQRAHRLSTLLTFSFWVQNTRRLDSPRIPSSRMNLTVPQRVRVPSTQSIDSRLSDSEGELSWGREPPSPIDIIPTIPEYLGFDASPSNNPVKVDLNCEKPGEDLSMLSDGPLFRSTLKHMQLKTENMRQRMKKVLKKAEAAKESQIMCNAAIAAFMEALREASSSNANAVQPALDHYFEKIAAEILSYERQNTTNLQRLIIDPLSKLYTNDIKQVDSKKKDFDEETKEFYSYVSRYLGKREDSMKDKKRAEVDSKYETKRRTFELKRFEYSSFMQDLHGGRKDQEVLSQLTKYADAQAKGFLNTSRKVEIMLPQLEALCHEVGETNKEYALLKTAREEKRRALETSHKSLVEGEAAPRESIALPHPPGQVATLNELGQANGKASVPQAARERPKSFGPLSAAMAGEQVPSSSPRIPSGNFSTSPGHDKFKGIRDLEERDRTIVQAGPDGSYRKEGILWSMSRPGSHSDPKGLNKAAWHKFWLVLDQGKLSEYVNWKTNMEAHSDPIDLRMASVREARNQDRRFCFEVITPHFTRVYQAPSEEEMKSWIQAVNNALQGAFEGKASARAQAPPDNTGSIGRDLFGKSSSFHGHRSISSSTAGPSSRTPIRHATVGDRPAVPRTLSSEERPAELLKSIRDADAGNAWCADCGSDARVEWVSINLGIIVCIECSGIHRSLGTHITKIRSLTLDTVSFTQDIVELLLLIGNRVSNMIFEATLDASSGLKPTPNSTRDHRSRFITAKYSEHAYVEPLAKAAPRFHSSDDLLLTSIKTNDIRNSLYALAVRANPNVTDRSRATPALFLALAAADPAMPSATLQSPPQGHQRKSFPIAELLLQNGADLPTQLPPIQLSASAKVYLDFKRDQKLGIKARQLDGSSGGGSSAAYSMSSEPFGSMGAASSAGGADVLSPLPRDVDSGRMRDKLMKRGSVGARLTKPNAPAGL